MGSGRFVGTFLLCLQFSLLIESYKAWFRPFYKNRRYSDFAWTWLFIQELSKNHVFCGYNYKGKIKIAKNKFGNAYSQNKGQLNPEYRCNHKFMQKLCKFRHFFRCHRFQVVSSTEMKLPPKIVKLIPQLLLHFFHFG